MRPRAFWFRSKCQGNFHDDGGGGDSVTVLAWSNTITEEKHVVRTVRSIAEGYSFFWG